MNRSMVPVRPDAAPAPGTDPNTASGPRRISAVEPAAEPAVLKRYRVMAYTTAVLLIVLVFVGVPLQVAGHPGVATVVGTCHGFLYLIYLFVAFQLTRTMHIPLLRTVLVLIAGTVPFGAIIAERRLTSEYSRQVRRAARGNAGTAPQEA
jgi:integral membrane protein